MRTKHLDCDCGCADHIIRFIYDDEDGDLWLEVQLTKTHGFFKRIWLAIKYIFGYNCRYGHWDCTLIKPEDKQALIDLIKESIRC